MYCGNSSQFPTNWTSIQDSYIAAPYWSDSDIRLSGDVCYEVHNDRSGSSILRDVSDIIHKLSGASFSGYWLLAAEWSNVHPFPHGASYLARLSSDVQEYAKKVCFTPLSCVPLASFLRLTSIKQL